MIIISKREFCAPKRCRSHQGYLRRQKGVVLLAVLVLMIVVTLLVSSASQLLDKNIELAYNAKISLEDAAIAQAKASEILYLLATQRITNAGLSQGTNTEAHLINEEGYFVNTVLGDELRLDGFLYNEDERNVVYKIQSNAGLIGINSREQIWLRKWLESTQLSELEMNRLLDSLADYADENDDIRAAGTELDSKYPSQNYLLQRCEQLYSIKYWNTFLSNYPQFLSHCSTRRTASVDVNTLPLSLWKRLMPLSYGKILEQRNQGTWFSRSEDAIFIESSLQNISDDYFSTKGDEGYTITVKRNNYLIVRHVERGKGGGLPIFEL